MIREFMPENIDLSNRLLGSDFNKSEVETIARNIVLLFKDTGGWHSFTWPQYKKYCTHESTNTELYFINQMVKDRWLNKIGDLYSVTHKFLGCVEKFLIEKTGETP